MEVEADDDCCTCNESEKVSAEGKQPSAPAGSWLEREEEKKEERREAC